MRGRRRRETEPRASRLAGFAAGAALLVTAGALAYCGADDSRASSQPAPPATPSTAVASGDGHGEARMRMVVVTWTWVAGIRLPTAPGVGPGDASHGLARKFQRSPLGAAIAAAHIGTRTTPHVGPAVFEQTISGQVTGFDASTLASATAVAYQRERARQKAPDGAPLQTSRKAKVAGYRVEASYGGDTGAGHAPREVALRLLVIPVPLAPTEVRVTMRWHGGDWRLVAPRDGDWSAVTGPAAAAEQYVLFKARSRR